MRPTVLCGMLPLVLATPAIAQSERVPFTGPVIGIEGGMAEQHFFLEKSIGDEVIDARYYRDYGPAVGAFAGYDLAVARNLRLGVEVAAVSGWSANTTRTGIGQELSYRPRYGYRATARAGIVLHDAALAYASVGYGGNRYDVTNTAGVTGEVAKDWGSSFVLGGGIEFRVTDRLGMRFDVKHVDNESNQFFVGIPLRF